MSEDIIRLETITQVHEALGFPKPQHPLISVIDVSKMKLPEEMAGKRMTSSFYTISMKTSDCGIRYGRNYYDFEEGVLVFFGPNQVVASENDDHNAEGWMLFFHPDLIRGTNLGRSIDQYSFFSYDVHEALHLSDQEKRIMNDMVARIEYEYNQNIDGHSQRLFASSLELMLNYCLRFYERQFHTRKAANTDVVTKVENLLKGYYRDELQLQHGTPNVSYLADQVALSPNYLSDLLKKETGANAKDHINAFVVDRAKMLLLNSTENVSSIAYDLGFNYPHYFSRMFKQKTGMTPQQYREADLN
jgi:AraC-like DNA-binding protein